MKSSYDPVLLEIFRNILSAITDEMAAALVRTAYSTNIKDRRDCSCAIYLPNGDVVAQSEMGTPLHLGVMPAVIRTILKKHPVSTLNPGDGIIYNNPYPEGPGHLNDITLVSPVFFEDKVVALVANQAHHIDVGGYTPGSMPFGVTEIYQVGLQIPPIKIIQESVFDGQIMDLIAENVRTKNEFKGDISAQHAANNVGDRGVRELFQKYGRDLVLDHMSAILDYSETRMRNGIRKIKDGIYEFEDYIEGDSITDDKINIRVKVCIEGDEVSVDFSGTSKEVMGPINCRQASAEACVFYVMKCVADPGLPPNAGSYRPIHTIAPDGTLVNSRYPRSVVHSNIITTHRIVDALMGALLHAIPERVMAAHHGTQNLVTIGGETENDKTMYNYIETYGGGQGALHCQDGMDGVHSHMTNTRNAPVEIIEATYPLRILRYGLVPDSEGAGCFRGGMGIFREFQFLENNTKITISSDRNKIQPWGVFSGKSAANAKCILLGEGNEVLDVAPKSTFTVHKKYRFVTLTSGGGGWGDPLLRDSGKVKTDVEQGLVSIERAASDYGVVIKSNGTAFDIDHRRTKELREKRHKESTKC